MPERDSIKTGERRTATLLFSDMKGFTSLSERMDPEEMDSLMTRLFGVFEEIIKAYGGFVEKYIGDALVAVFGVPDLHEDDPSRAVHAAMEFLSRVRAVVDSLPNGSALSSGGGILFRTGIHEGLVTTGRRGEFDVVTGHAMSVAERLEAAAAPGSILVSEAVKEKCEADFDFGPRVEVEAKGKTEPIAAYAVLGEAQAIARAPGRDAGPFVGRRELIDEMLKAYMRNRYDEVSGFYLMGEAGIGKSRVVQALAEKIRLFPDFDTPILFARAQKYRSGGFALIVDILLGCLGLGQTGVRGAAGGAARTDREAVTLALAPYAALPGASAQRFVDLVCREDPGNPDAASIAALYDVFDAILVKHSSDLFPILVCIDNANFMDRLSREFFQYLFKNGRIKPFFVLAGRDFPPELRKAFQGLRAVKVPPLKAEEAEAFVRSRWPGIEAEALRRIAEAGMGNPLFLREYAGYARKHKDLSSLPATVQNMFLSSLERYPPEWRELAARLSVFAHSFCLDEASALQKGAGGDVSIVAAALETFERDELIVGEAGAFSFRADVFKKALYSSLLNHNKRVLHGLIADMLLSRERPNRARLMLHLVRAERYDEAARAMQDDPNLTSDAELLPYVDLLLKRIRDEKARVKLLIAKSAILFNSGKIEESEAVLQKIMRAALTRGDPDLMGFAYHQICNYSAMTYAFQKTVLTGQKALYYFGRSQAGPRSAQNVLRTIALAQVMRGNADEASRLVERCEAVPGGDPFEALEARAELQLLTGGYARSAATIDESLSRMPAERTASRFYAYDFKIRALWQLCDFQGIREPASRLLALGPLSESVLSQSNAMYALSCVFSGEREAARERFVQAEFYAAQILNDFAKVDALRSLALCRYLAGESAKAESTALEALTLGLRHSCYWPTFTLLILLAEYWAERGKDDRARFFLVEASYLFSSGLHLPSKDLILYYYFASRLLDPAQAERNMAVALRLFEDEKARLGKGELVANFLSMRSYGRLQAALEAAGGEAPPVPAEDLR
jgi:class 3 adenylate cyclase